MKVTDFDFSLPENLVAKMPAEKRDCSRLLVLHIDGAIEHKEFYALPEYLSAGDMLLLNNTKVFPARLSGIKQTGGKIEFLLVKEAGHDTWEILSRGKWSGKLSISEEFSAEITEGRVAHFSYSGDFMENLWKYGNMPLPPYIKRSPQKRDKEWYQTVYAKKQGSIAAPTAGLHFTPELIKKIKDMGVKVRYLTLHVGIGTFKPIRGEELKEHTMEPEYFEFNLHLIREIQEAKETGKRLFTVGTTTTRAIEGYFSGRWTEIQGNGSMGKGVKVSKHQSIKDSDALTRGRFDAHPGPRTLECSKVICGYTDIFIYPGYEFRAVNSLITNFHLPRSTPLMLASAFCGFGRLKKAYDEAAARKYRFFSYGDAMLIL